MLANGHVSVQGKCINATVKIHSVALPNMLACSGKNISNIPAIEFGPDWITAAYVGNCNRAAVDVAMVVAKLIQVCTVHSHSSHLR